MDREKLEGMLIDYIDNRLNTVDRTFIERELVSNPDTRKLYEELREVIIAMEQSSPLEPSTNLRTNFQKDLAAEINASKGKAIFFNPRLYRVAAAVTLMILSGAIGFWISRNNAVQERLAYEKEMEATRKQLAETKQAMFGMLDNEYSASQRIKGVSVALDLPKPDDEIIEVLFETLHNDPNTNVRLAALEALERFQEDPAVRRGLITGLTKQTDPMVQIRLIQLMVEMKEKQVVDDLKQMVDDAGTMKAVKDEAYSGILKLS
ncbi:MAG TPA: HEAT repeat domain-containing protein [Chryseosolibacter sp.]|nr:HEAT repeat domain-containing protein [Chryseosolibacter sp.]